MVTVIVTLFFNATDGFGQLSICRPRDTPLTLAVPVPPVPKPLLPALKSLSPRMAAL